MGRMSDVDLDIREELEEEMKHGSFNEYEREEYIQENYDRVAITVINRIINAARMVR